MIAVVVIATALIGSAAVLALVRLERGPSILDRTVAFDVLTTTIVGAVAVEAAWSRRTESIPILAVLSLVGFVGSVAIARFAAREPEERQDAGSGAEPATAEPATAEPATAERTAPGRTAPARAAPARAAPGRAAGAAAPGGAGAAQARRAGDGERRRGREGGDR